MDFAEDNVKVDVSLKVAEVQTLGAHQSERQNIVKQKSVLRCSA